MQCGGTHYGCFVDTNATKHAQYPSQRINTSVSNSQPETSLTGSRQPHVRHTSDGLEVELPACADYDRELLTVTEAATGRIVADGGSELEATIYRCGDRRRERQFVVHRRSDRRTGGLRYRPLSRLRDAGHE